MRRDAFDWHERERTRLLIARAEELRKRSDSLIGRSQELCRKNAAVRKLQPDPPGIVHYSQSDDAGAP